MNDFLTVTTFLWHDDARVRSYKFDPSHVVVLRNMVKRHLSIDHEFVCVTDRPFKEDGIRCAPLDMSKHVPGTCFVRLMLRHPRIGSLLGRRILNLDLDCVVVDSLNQIVDRREPSVFWRNPNWPAPGRAFYQTSIQLLDAGSHSELWTDFDPKVTPSWVNRRYGGREQAWASERLSHDLPHWTDADGIYGAGRLFNGSPDNGVQTELPKNARIVFFPGNREPSQLEVQQMHPWIGAHYK